jgi:peptidoglycan/xylan/chitin deacetylase (PgdA/CDA1 family)
MPPVFQSRAVKAAALVGSGFSSFTRTRRAAEATILTFHGLCEDAGSPDILDWTLHLPVEVFRSVCAMLASDYRVVSLADLIAAQNNQLSLPDNSVVITFDDGYESNFKLAYPILRRFNLPATIFVTTGFLDGVDMLWFQRVDLALGRTRKENLEWKINGNVLRLHLGTREQRQQSLVQLMPELKELPDADLLDEVDRLERALEVHPPTLVDLPAPMRPMSWDMAREMADSGLIEIGGHSHTHPILSRCDSMTMRAEISTCRDRIRAELGDLPASFAYPNGGEGDYTRETMLLVREAGFKCACSTINGRVGAEAPMFQLPRYGSPESVWEAEATVSGAFETLKEWRRSCLKAMSLI